MLKQIQDQRDEGKQDILPKIQSDNQAFSDFLMEYEEKIIHRLKMLSLQNKFIQKFNESSNNQQDQDLTNIQMQVESLQKINLDQSQDIAKKNEMIQKQKETIEQKLSQIVQLEGEILIGNIESSKLNYAAIAQAKVINEMHQSREKLTQQLEDVVLDRNNLIEVLKSDKMRMADQLNEINDLQEYLQRQRHTLEEDQERLKQQFKELQSQSNYKPLAPLATEAQIQRSMKNDIPGMVARKITKHHQAEIYDIAQNLNGSLIATCGGDRLVKIYDPLNLQQVSQFQAPGDEVYTTLCFSPSFECILLGSTDNSAQLWQISGMRLKSRLVGHSDQVTCVDYVGGEKDNCVTGSKDRTIKFWNSNTGQCIRSIQAGSMVNALKCQHNVPFVVSAHKDGSLRGYSLKQDGKAIFIVKDLFDDCITSVQMNQDCSKVLLCSKEGYSVKLFDLKMNKVIQSYSDDKYMNSFDHNRACFGPNEEFIIAGNADSSIIAWNYKGKFHKHTTKGQHEGIVLCVDYHPVSEMMYSADSRGNLVIWR